MSIVPSQGKPWIYSDPCTSIRKKSSFKRQALGDISNHPTKKAKSLRKITKLVEVVPVEPSPSPKYHGIRSPIQDPSPLPYVHPTISSAKTRQEMYATKSMELYCTNLLDDLVEYWKVHEMKYMPNMNIKSKEYEKSRGTIVQWMVALTRGLDLSEDTLYLAVNYFDRIVACGAFHKQSSQLIMMTCIFLASKYEDPYFATTDELVKSSGYMCTVEELLKGEQQILIALNFELCVTTILPFLRHYSVMAGLNKTETLFGQYLCELSLLSYSMLKYKPSTIACAAIALTRATFEDYLVWNTTLEQETGYKIKHLRDCVYELHYLHCKARKAKQPNNITAKYRSLSVTIVNMEPAEEEYMNEFD